MRPYIHRCLLIAAVLSLTCAAQAQTGSSSQNEGQSASSSASQSGQTTPPNPLTDTLSGADTKVQETQPQKSPSTFNVDSKSGQDQMVGEIRLMTRYTEIGGDQTRSFLVPGENDLAEINYFSDRSFLATHRIQMLTQFRATDDSSIDLEHDSVQKAYVRIFSPKDEIIVGDALVNFSRLTMSQNIKGLSVSKLFGGWKVSALSGVYIDRYGSLYKDLPGRPYMAVVEGLRLEKKLNSESAIGWNFSNSRDQINSLPFAPLGTTPEPADNKVGSMDAKIGWKKLRVDGEMAYSLTDFDLRDDAGCTSQGGCDSRLPQPALGFQGDWGARLESSYKYKRLTLRQAFVRYEPNFQSVNARQLADLQDMTFRAGYDLLDWLTVDGTVRRSNDDLKRELPFQTTNWGPEARLMFHDLSFFRRGSFEVGYRHRHVDTSNGSVDRFVRDPYVDFTIPIKTTTLTLGYERRMTVDFIDPSQTSNANHYSVGLRGIYDLANWHVTPSVRLELERTSDRPLLSALPIDYRLDYDTNRLDNIALGLEAPKWFILEMGYRNTGATIYGPAGYRRPEYHGQITYKIANDENFRFIFGFDRANNYYLNSTNYDERVWSGTFVYRFGKHASGL